MSQGPKDGRPDSSRRTLARPRARRGGDPAPLAALLAGAKATSQVAAGVSIDSDTWRKVVGPRISERTRPGAIRDRVLTVNAASAVWVQELSLLADEILGRLRGSGFKLDAIRFRVNEIACRTRSEPARTLVKPASLPEELGARISSIEDSELRSTIARAASLSLALGDAIATSTRPAARAPRSVAPESDPSAPTDPGPRAASRRSRADPED
jgi:hypothetical protein